MKLTLKWGAQGVDAASRQRLYTVDEMADRLGLSRSTVFGSLRGDDRPRHRGRRSDTKYMYSLVEVKAHLQKKGLLPCKPPTSSQESPARSPDGTLPSLPTTTLQSLQ